MKVMIILKILYTFLQLIFIFILFMRDEFVVRASPILMKRDMSNILTILAKRRSLNSLKLMPSRISKR